MMFLKYQLPSEPNVYVDLLDDEDVSLMFDEVRTQLHVMRKRPVVSMCMDARHCRKSACMSTASNA